MARRLTAVCLVAVLTALAGCGKGKVTVSGTVTRGGEKLTWPDGGYLVVIFIPEDRERDTNVYPARKTDLEGSTYEVEGIPPGRYKVAVQQMDPRSNDALGRVYNPGATTLEREVPSEGGTIDIDLPAPEGGGRPKGGRGGRPKGDPPAKGEPTTGEPAKPAEKKD